jgi:hypothetical protein
VLWLANRQGGTKPSRRIIRATWTDAAIAFSASAGSMCQRSGQCCSGIRLKDGLLVGSDLDDPAPPKPDP